MKENNIAISIQNLSKSFHRQDRGAPLSKKIMSLFLRSKPSKKFKVIDNLNINISKGEFIGIIGRNGSGKSTLLKLIIGAIKPDKGSSIISKGSMMRLALGIGFDPNLSAKDNIYINGTVIGLSLKQIGEKLEEILNFADLHQFINTPIRFFSSGMKSRLSFAIALHTNADILLIDEFFGAVGDENFKEKSQKAFEESVLKGRTIIHVSHSMRTIKENCDRVIFLNKGKPQIYSNPLHAIQEYVKSKSKT